MLVGKVSSVSNKVNFAKKDNENKKLSPVVRYGLPTVGGLAGAATGAVAVGHKMTLQDILRDPERNLDLLARKIKPQLDERTALENLYNAMNRKAAMPIIEQEYFPAEGPDTRTLDSIIEKMTDGEHKTLAEAEAWIESKTSLTREDLDEAYSTAVKEAEVAPEDAAKREAAEKAREACIDRQGAEKFSKTLNGLQSLVDGDGKITKNAFKEYLMAELNAANVDSEIDEAFTFLKQAKALPKRLSIIKGVIGAVIGVAVAIGAVKALAPKKTVDTQA